MALARRCVPTVAGGATEGQFQWYTGQSGQRGQLERLSIVTPLVKYPAHEHRACDAEQGRYYVHHSHYGAEMLSTEVVGHDREPEWH